MAEGTLTRDDAQEAVLPHFERIRRSFGGTIQSVGSSGKAPPPPKGLYLWGGVGRGKSMLMDMFVDALGDIPARRVHFHAFMQEIHCGHAQGPSGRCRRCAWPRWPQEVVKSVRVLAFDEMQITDITDAMIVGRLFDLLHEGGVVVV